MKRNKLFWLGLFSFGGMILLVWGIFLLGTKKKIFEQTFHLHSPFETVAGLREGSPVRLSGIDIGVVETIALPARPGGKVVVTMRLDEAAQHLIRRDAYTVIETEGLVGNKIVAIKGGSVQLAHVTDEDSIRSRSPVDLSAILDSFDETARYMRLVTASLDGITSKIRSGEGTIGKLVYDEEFYQNLILMTERSDSTFAAAFAETRRLGDLLTKVSTSVDSVIKRVESGQGTLGALVYKDDLYNLTYATVSATQDSLQALLHDMRRGRGLLGKVISDETLAAELDTSVRNLARLHDELMELSRLARAGAFSFAENMEALKHNWLFKGYFERRGFWNRAEFEKDYADRMRELSEREARLNEYEKTLGQQFRQVQELHKQVQRRLQLVEELEKKLRPAEPQAEQQKPEAQPPEQQPPEPPPPEQEQP